MYRRISDCCVELIPGQWLHNDKGRPEAAFAVFAGSAGYWLSRLLSMIFGVTKISNSLRSSRVSVRVNNRPR